MPGWKSTLRRALEFVHLVPRTNFTAAVSPDHPVVEQLSVGCVYVVGGRGYQKWAYLRCPCGCAEPIMLSLSNTRRPRWSVTADWLDRATIYPSVRQTAGCHSHFWIKRGRLQWCADTGRQE